MSTIRENLNLKEANSIMSLIAEHTQPQMIKLSTSLLTSKMSYQRNLDYNFIKKNIANYDQNKVRPVVVSYRDGKYNVIDGQHTVAIVKGHNGGKDCEVLCQVLYGLSLEQEAKLYSEQYKDKHRLSAAEQWKGSEVARDERTLNILNAVRKVGIDMDYEHISSDDNRITCFNTIAKSYDKLGAKQFIRMLTLLKNTYHGDRDSLSKRMIDGMTEFMLLYSKDFSDSIFIAKLSRTTPIKIINEAMSDKLSPNNAIKVAKVIFKYYNARQQKYKLPSRFVF